MFTGIFHRRHSLRLATAGIVALALGGGVALVLSGPASAANVSVGQCNGINDTGGLTTTCEVVIINNLTNNPGTTGSSVSLNGGTPTTSSDLVTSVTQCNASGNGGGGTLTCSVSITNNIAINGPGAASAATVNQCVGSGGPSGNPLGPPLPGNPDPCTPFPATTTGATITQCNGSAVGGGLVAPSTCDASGTVSSSLPVTINQCNGSVGGGGSKINCSSTITTNVVDTTPTGTGGTGATGGTTGSGGGTTGGTGGTTGGTGGTTGGSTLAGGPTAHGSGGTAAGSTAGVIPTGAPQTGFGGATHAPFDDLIALGALALAGSVAACATAMPRRRRLAGREGSSGSS